ncbi:MAG: hypothetical protein QNL63_07680 [Paracoccaceae bacterium]
MSLDPAVTDPVIAELAVIDHAVIDPTALAAYAVLDLCVRRHVDTSIQSPLVNWLP